MSQSEKEQKEPGNRSSTNSENDVLNSKRGSRNQSGNLTNPEAPSPLPSKHQRPNRSRKRSLLFSYDEPDDDFFAQPKKRLKRVKELKREVTPPDGCRGGLLLLRNTCISVMQLKLNELAEDLAHEGLVMKNGKRTLGYIRFDAADTTKISLPRGDSTVILQTNPVHEITGADMFAGAVQVYLTDVANKDAVPMGIQLEVFQPDRRSGRQVKAIKVASHALCTNPDGDAITENRNVLLVASQDIQWVFQPRKGSGDDVCQLDLTEGMGVVCNAAFVDSGRCGYLMEPPRYEPAVIARIFFTTKDEENGR